MSPSITRIRSACTTPLVTRALMLSDLAVLPANSATVMSSPPPVEPPRLERGRKAGDGRQAVSAVAVAAEHRPDRLVGAVLATVDAYRYLIGCHPLIEQRADGPGRPALFVVHR